MVTRRIVNVKRIRTRNIGDLKSSPFEYWNKLPVVSIEHCLSPRNRRLLDNAKLVIFGGGGLLNYPKWDVHLKCLVDKYAEKTVVWGAGTNLHDGDKRNADKFLDKFAMVGIRDYGTKYEYIPCPSCLSSVFDRLTKEECYKGGMGIIENVGWTQKIKELIPGIRKIKNANMPFMALVRVILSKDLIITNSYHCVYWSILCRVPVVGIRTTDKFDYLKYPVPVMRHDNWDEMIGYRETFMGILEESRKLNLDFMNEIKNKYFK